jgi:putative ABC transport system ATP-binding protein
VFDLRGLKHAYGSAEVLNVAAWRVEQGSQWLVWGPSGSGKTTLLHIPAGILSPAAGRVRMSAA